MLWYIFKRLILMVISLFIIVSMVFILTRVSMLQIWGAPHPIGGDFAIAWEEYLIYIQRILKDWYWGVDEYYIPIWDTVISKALISFRYNLIAFIIYFFFGIFFGFIAAFYKNKWQDFVISFFSMLFNSIPGFVMIFLLILVFAYHFNWLPAQEPYQIHSVARKLKGYIIPVIALSIGPMGRIAQIIRNELVESTQSPQYLLLRAKGLTRKQSFIKHGLKDSMVTLIPELVPLLVFVINMSFVIEYTYNINGLALYFFESLLSFSGTGDGLNSVAVNTLVVVPISVLLMGTIMIFSLVTDVSLALIDPRISIRSKKTKSNIV